MSPRFGHANPNPTNSTRSRRDVEVGCLRRAFRNLIVSFLQLRLRKSYRATESAVDSLGPLFNLRSPVVKTATRDRHGSACLEPKRGSAQSVAAAKARHAAAIMMGLTASPP